MVHYSNHGKTFALTIDWVENYLLGSRPIENLYLIVTGAIKLDTENALQVPRLGLLNLFATKVKVTCIENIDELNSVLTECCKTQDLATESDVSPTVIVLLGLFGHFERPLKVVRSQNEDEEEEDVPSDEKKFPFLARNQCNVKAVQDICYMLHLVESRKGFKVFVNDYCNSEPDMNGKPVPVTWKILVPIDEESDMGRCEEQSCKLVTMGTILERWISV